METKGFENSMGNTNNGNEVTNTLKDCTKITTNYINNENKTTNMSEQQNKKIDTDLTLAEKEILVKIVNDKYSVGSFTGMIFNKYIELQKDSINYTNDKCPIKLVETAIRIRRLIQEMAK